MATTITKYDQLSSLLANGLIDFDADTLKLALIESTYAFDATDTLFSEVSGDETSGTGYTAGGETLTGQALNSVGTVTTLDADDVVWSALTSTFRSAVIYAVGTFGGIVNPIIAFVLFDDTPADVSVAGIDFQVAWNASGVMTVD